MPARGPTSQIVHTYPRTKPHTTPPYLTPTYPILDLDPHPHGRLTGSLTAPFTVRDVAPPRGPKKIEVLFFFFYSYNVNPIPTSCRPRGRHR